MARSDLKIQPYSINTNNTGYITFGDVLDWERTQPFSVTGWFSVATSNGTNQTLISKRNSGAAGWEFFVHDFNNVRNKVSFAMEGSNGGYIEVSVDAAFNTRDEWVALAMTYDGSSDSSGIKFYDITGLTASSSFQNTLTASILTNTALNIGTKNGAIPLRGAFSNVVIHDVELNAQGVADALNNLFYTSVAASWDWTTGTGSTLTGLVGGLDGTITSPADWSTDAPGKAHTAITSARSAITSPRVSVS